MPRNGSPAPVVLGLCSGTHDSAAALIVDGQLVGMVEEERLNGVKHSNAYPEQSVAWLLQRAGLAPDAVTHVAYNFDPRRYLAGAALALPYLLRPSTARRALPRASSFAHVHRNARARFRHFRARFPSARLVNVEHHLAHGMYALAAGIDGQDDEFRDTAVLVVDSLGERVTTSISHAHHSPTGVELRRVRNITDPASLGYIYGAVTQHLGWRRGDEEGTVMALAALGDPARFRALFARAIPIDADGFGTDIRLFPLRVLSHHWPRVSDEFITATCPPRPAGAPIEQIHKDLAAALQERVEQVMVHLAQRTRETTAAQHLAIGGGVAMNCLAIGRICQQAGFGRVSVPPAPGDSGTSAGAALAVAHRLTGRLPSGAGACYLGPEYSRPEMSFRPRPGLTAVQLASPAAMVALRLAEGQIIGVFQGRLEAGARALGNRSILASPLKPAVVDRLNVTVKYREPFRPFAPVVLDEHAAEYFTLEQSSPFMSIASGVTARTIRELGSVVHTNGTARVQTVTPEQNPFLAEVLAAFATITGHPVLINTSLNIKGKPICGTPDAALDCLTESGLDALLIENWWITKNSVPSLATESEPTA